MIDKIWGKMLNIGKDKFWHFICFREFTAILIKTGLSPIWVIAIGVLLGIGKELWDWTHGRYFDFGDLFADLLGIGLGFIN